MNKSQKEYMTKYRTVKINGLDIFTEKQVQRRLQQFCCCMAFQHHHTCFAT